MRLIFTMLIVLFSHGCAELDGVFPKFNSQNKIEEQDKLPTSASVTQKQMLLSEENLLLQKKIDELKIQILELQKKQKKQRDDFLLLREQWEMNFVLLERSIEESLGLSNVNSLENSGVLDVNDDLMAKKKNIKIKTGTKKILPIENFSLLKNYHPKTQNGSVEKDELLAKNNLNLEDETKYVEEEPGFPEVGRVNLNDLEDANELTEREKDVILVGIDSSETSNGSMEGLGLNKFGISDPDLNPPEEPLILIRHPGVKKIYNQGMTALIQKNHLQSIRIFENFTKRFPNNVDSDNAYYWIGRSYFEISEYKKAESAFRKVLTQYEHRPTSQGYKTPDSIYMLGKLQHKRKDEKRAFYYFEEVIKRFPGSAAARNAKRELGK